MNDYEAMNVIAVILDGEVWTPGTLDRIADVVRETGRECRDPDDDGKED